MKAGIISWGAYIPKYRIKAEEIAKSHGKNPENIKNSLKIIEKAVPGIDEDTATIAVAAARDSLKRVKIDPQNIGSIYIGSESHPYAVKPTGTILGEALGVGNNYTTADFEFACKAGTAAMQVSLAMTKSGYVKFSLCGGCDTAQSKPGDALEYTAAAGGAVFLIGNESDSNDDEKNTVENSKNEDNKTEIKDESISDTTNINISNPNKPKPVAIINHTVSFTSDTPDFWRREKQKFPSHAGSFTGQPAYFRHVINATKNLLEKAKTKPEDYNHVIFHQPNGKFPRRVAKTLGFTNEQIKIGLLVDRIGNTYSGASLLGLAAVLDVAKPKDRILLTSYGSGAGSDSFDITVTDEIVKVQKEGKENRVKTVEEQIENKKYVDYNTYLKYTKKVE